MSTTQRVLLYFAYYLILHGGLAFMLCSYASWVIADHWMIPMCNPSSIAIDARNGHIYVGSPFSTKLHVYDREGNEVLGWYVDSAGGEFYVRSAEEGGVKLFVERGDVLFRYNARGELVDETFPATEKGAAFRESPRHTTAPSGEEYWISHPLLFPRIKRRDRDGIVETIVWTSAFQWLIAAPLPAFMFFAAGITIVIKYKGISPFKVRQLSAKLPKWLRIRKPPLSGGDRDVAANGV